MNDLVEMMQKGSPALFPTDTLPALAAYPVDASKLWILKNRPKNKPLILMGASAEELLKLVVPRASEDAQNMSIQYWPGPLTMVLPVSDPIVDALNPGAQYLGMRVPDCEMTRNFLANSGPLATTSANLSGSIPLLTAKDAATCFKKVPLLGPLPWPIPSGCASSVISWQSKGRWRVLRGGAVLPSESLRE